MKSKSPEESEKKTNKSSNWLVAGIVLPILLITGGLLYYYFFWSTERNTLEIPPARSAAMELTQPAAMGPLQVEENLTQPTTPSEETPPILAMPLGDNSSATSSGGELPNNQGVPRAFGFESDSAWNPESNQNNQTNLTNQESFEEPIPLKKPTEVPAATPTPSEVTTTGVTPADPRQVGITANDGPEKEYEETSLTIQRTLSAVMGPDNKQLIRLKIPVMYKSRTLRLEGETLAEAIRIKIALKEKSKQLETLKIELDTLLADWNKLVTQATPHDALLPESPSLPQNQSTGELNRENNPEMEAGKAISYEMITP